MRQPASANVFVRENEQGDGVYLYAHDAGMALPQITQAALRRFPDRWDDPQYLARIIFSAMIRDDLDSELNFGISATLREGRDRVLVVDTVAQEVRYQDERTDPPHILARIPIEQFVGRAAQAWPR
jgi:hypothetical protein